MIVGYARVSTTDQDASLQVARLYAAGCEQVFAEKRSGTTIAKRTELEACLRTLRPGDTLFVTKLDRFGRNVKDLIHLFERVEKSGATFKCLDQPLDISGPLGRLMRNMLSIIAEFENDMRRERQLEGIAAAKAKGVYKPNGRDIPTGRLAHASRILKSGEGFKAAAERTGIHAATLRRHFPQYADPARSALAKQREARRRESASATL